MLLSSAGRFLNYIATIAYNTLQSHVGMGLSVTAWLWVVKHYLCKKDNMNSYTLYMFMRRKAYLQITKYYVDIALFHKI